ncbi:Abi family protein [Schumannella luteola]|uniref:Abi-like protein n=1 Tax=Schumannella luteola TaxID=472059 RepID=A0A852YJR8_9MICO|nr:hypothetical protein [Schumannella luteola]NYG97999.1 hypothetical protein [Schumannella luteola]TPX01733.1 Abi family protein [Schumannella luteola]
MSDTELRGAFLELIHFAEVALRDRFDRALAPAYGSHWFKGRTVLLDDRTLDKFREAEGRVTHTSKHPARVIAEVSLGGWGYLLEVGGVGTGGGGALAGRADYERDLWDGRIEALFSGTITTRQEAAALVRRVRRLRNRVAHHESVVFGVHQPGERDAVGNHKRQLPASALADVRQLLELFCPTAAAWLATCNHVDELLADQLLVDALNEMKTFLPKTQWF